ncbi:GlsB/YeaQ/YmgE family stress response membrane protein [Aeromicrobium massiliense]|uniref:GlsB/YeaQ/YmgE family stress response membrane protein n=1 Tax=Aeromicrobium massiliense TaxID=1464554 RepID=UPI0002E0AB40|nr:GlsB/YeaQ/YmgE family stress response membrane protein [Aeromicrobium massiliense]
MGIIGFIIVGLIAGFLARAIVPGKDSMGILATIVLGMVGSFVGGLLGSLISGDGIDFSAAGIIGSIVGAIIVLIAYNAFTGKKKSHH